MINRRCGAEEIRFLPAGHADPSCARVGEGVEATAIIPERPADIKFAHRNIGETAKIEDGEVETVCASFKEFGADSISTK